MSREYWDQWLAKRREHVRMDMPFLKELLQRSITTLLDVGSGQGGGVKRFAELGFRVTCIDSSLKSIQYLHSLSEDPSVKHLNIVCADLLSLPFCDNSFGAVTAMNVMNFFTEKSERERAFSELFRVVNPRGVMLFVVISDRDDAAKRGTPLGGGNFRLHDGICLHYYTTSELEHLLQDMTILELNHHRQVDTSHDIPHAHALIRVLACHES